MKDGTKNIIAACILALGMIFSTYLYVSAYRYEIDKPYRIDKWTGTAKYITWPD